MTAPPTSVTPTVMEAHSYIVLRDTQVFSRGTIVERDSSGRCSYHGHHFKRISFFPTCLSAQDVAPLTEEECVILGGIGGIATRYTVYSTPGLLTWGVGLKVGDTVLARLPDKSGRGHSAGAQQDQYATAIIRWTGQADGYTGHRFGVEITVSFYSPSNEHSYMCVFIISCLSRPLSHALSSHM